MRPTLLRRLDAIARQLGPFALTLAFVLGSAVPLPIPGSEAVAPWLALMCVFYWSLYRPDLMPAVAVFAIGIFEDALTGMTIGISAAVFVLVHATVNAQRRFFLNKPFAIVWLGFALIAFGAFAAAWLLNCIFFGMLIDVPAVLARAVVTIGCFPVIAWLLLRCHLSLLGST
jgi:rod shape-determining protein MreD